LRPLASPEPKLLLGVVVWIGLLEFRPQLGPYRQPSSSDAGSGSSDWRAGTAFRRDAGTAGIAREIKRETALTPLRRGQPRKISGNIFPFSFHGTFS
jgi:hypothetical protein